MLDARSRMLSGGAWHPDVTMSSSSRRRAWHPLGKGAGKRPTSTGGAWHPDTMLSSSSSRRAWHPLGKGVGKRSCPPDVPSLTILGSRRTVGECVIRAQTSSEGALTGNAASENRGVQAGRPSQERNSERSPRLRAGAGKKNGRPRWAAEVELIVKKKFTFQSSRPERRVWRPSRRSLLRSFHGRDYPAPGAAPSHLREPRR